MGEEGRPGPDQRLAKLFGEAERQAADATEQLVQRQAFGELLARLTENFVGVARIGMDAADLVVRNLRLAGRTDVTRLGRQLARTEDKLERVLQEVEELRNELAARPAPRAGRSRQSGSRSTGNGRGRAGARSTSGSAS